MLLFIKTFREEISCQLFNFDRDELEVEALKKLEKTEVRVKGKGFCGLKLISFFLLGP